MIQAWFGKLLVVCNQIEINILCINLFGEALEHCID